MLQNYLDVHSVAKRPFVLQPAKLRLALLALLSLVFATYTVYLFNSVSKPEVITTPSVMPETPPIRNDFSPVGGRVDRVTTVVAKALYFKSLLTT